MAKGTTSKASGGGFGNAVSNLVKSITGSGSTDTRRAEDKAAKAPSYSAVSVKGLTSSDPANVARNQAAAKMYADMPASVSKDRPEAPAAPPAAAAPVTPTRVVLPVAPPPTLVPPPAPLPVVPVQPPAPPTPAPVVEGPAAAKIPVLSGIGTTSAAGGAEEAKSMIGATNVAEPVSKAVKEIAAQTGLSESAATAVVSGGGTEADKAAVSGSSTASSAAEAAKAAIASSPEATAATAAVMGRRSNILTSALGLLADAEATGQLRKRRSLMGGGLIK